ncbi:LAQU0S07e05028g1_1 [Lachancea quebecensis]|uniref:LAQU0S07e05028g1_1 n=1 Tax=Lachancea quebecensis TaxID=1654605 RepID=A0A0P1KUZ8_9SACH|nr:LAQU0S07e05028g1_1 [Lachancea quebecensis]
MASRGITITTKKAIITSKSALILNHDKFLPPTNIINEYPHDDVLRMCYRRHMRLKPFISQRSMIQTTYVDYVRYKYKNEDYPKKCRTSGMGHDLPVNSVLQQAELSLRFCLQAVMYVKKGVPDESSVSREIRLSRNMLKNILAIEHEKAKLIAQNPRQNYPILRETFSYISPTAHKSSLLLRFNALREFDMCLIGFNMCMGTKL